MQRPNGRGLADSTNPALAASTCKADQKQVAGQYPIPHISATSIPIARIPCMLLHEGQKTFDHPRRV